MLLSVNMSDRRYTNKDLEISYQKALKSFGRRLFKVVTRTALSLCLLSVGEVASINRSLASSQVQAQTVTTDGTTSTTVDSITAPDGGSGFTITNGTLKGNNLFHSFDIFSPGSAYTLFDLNDSVYDSVDNVFNRVTGNSNTFINGLLQLSGGNSPNFYLLNPNGISLGTGARLDVPASFFATTAEQISFEDGTPFSAADTSTAPLLTISAPVGIQFGASAAPINWTGNGALDGRGQPALTAFFRPNSAVTLLGGDIGIENIGLGTSSGLIQLGSVAANTQVKIDGESHALTYQPDTQFNDISISRARIDTSAIGNVDFFEGSSGHLSLRGRNITVDSSNLVSDNIGPDNGGTTDIRASQTFAFSDSRITTTLYDGFNFTPSNGLPYTLYPSAGNGGNIYIEAQDFIMRPVAAAGSNLYDAKIGADTYSDGKGGFVTINADTVSLIGTDERSTPENNLPSVRLVSNSFEKGDGGGITINARELTVAGSAIISSSTYSAEGSEDAPGTQSGMGGSITLQVKETLNIENGAQIGTVSLSDGDAGNLSIDAGDVILSDQTEDPTLANRATTTQITTSSYEDGNGGNLTIEANSLRLSGTSNILASSFFQGAERTEDFGEGGSIKIDANTVSIEDRASIGTDTFTDGDAGNVVVTTDQLSIVRGTLSAQTSGKGRAGNVEIRADEIFVADPVFDPIRGSISGIVALVSATGSGSGGQIDIVSNRLHLANGGQVTASSEGAGVAGSVIVRANELLIEGSASVKTFDALIAPDAQIDSAISSRSTTGFDAGSVEVTAERIEVRDRGTITVSNTAGGSAGNVNIAANRVKLDNGSVQAEASAGTQGNLNINSRDVLLMRNGSRLTANATGAATGGNVNLNAPLIIGTSNSDISTNAIEGDGGNIRLVTRGLIGLAFRDRLTDQSDITASSELGVSGTIEIESPNAEVDSGLVELPENLEDASNQVSAGCAVQASNQFTHTGRGGLPNNPVSQLSSNRPWIDLRMGQESVGSISATGSVRSSQAVAAESLQEAGQWQVNAGGEVELIASSPVKNEQSDCLEQTMAALQNPL